MAGRIIELSTDNRRLHVDHGFLVVKERDDEIARVPLDNIAAIIGQAHGLTYTNNLLVELANRNIPLVVCGANFLPVAWLWSLDGNDKQSGRIDAQLRATLPKSKQIWKQLIQSKIAQQAAVLEATGHQSALVSALVRQVRSGDPDNIEAQAARRYWPLLFGSDFRRDREAAGVNALLNYGYMIVRSAVARAVMGAGLHPSIGVHHSNAYNAMRLVDDMIEPFRPFVDCTVWHLAQSGSVDLTPTVKRKLVAVLEAEVSMPKATTSLHNAVTDAVTSLSFLYLDQRTDLVLPLPVPPLWLGGMK